MNIARCLQAYNSGTYILGIDNIYQTELKNYSVDENSFLPVVGDLIEPRSILKLLPIKPV